MRPLLFSLLLLAGCPKTTDDSAIEDDTGEVLSTAGGAVTIDLGALEPLALCGHGPGEVRPVRELQAIAPRRLRQSLLARGLWARWGPRPARHP